MFICSVLLYLGAVIVPENYWNVDCTAKHKMKAIYTAKSKKAPRNSNFSELLKCGSPLPTHTWASKPTQHGVFYLFRQIKRPLPWIITGIIPWKRAYVVDCRKSSTFSTLGDPVLLPVPANRLSAVSGMIRNSPGNLNFLLQGQQPHHHRAQDGGQNTCHRNGQAAHGAFDLPDFQGL